MPREDHVHKYRRTDAGVNKKYLVYTCGDPECPKPTHYLIPRLVIGKKTRCNECDVACEMTAEMATTAKPRCFSCRNKGTVESISELMTDLLSGLPVGKKG